jgi:hypothetical protein
VVAGARTRRAREHYAIYFNRKLVPFLIVISNFSNERPWPRPNERGGQGQWAGAAAARIGAVERELKEFHADMDAEFRKVHAGLALVRDEFATVRTEIREGDEETRRYMRVLYEELVERIKIMGEGIEELRRRP